MDKLNFEQFPLLENLLKTLAGNNLEDFTIDVSFKENKQGDNFINYITKVLPVKFKLYVPEHYTGITRVPESINDEPLDDINNWIKIINDPNILLNSPSDAQTWETANTQKADLVIYHGLQAYLVDVNGNIIIQLVIPTESSYNDIVNYNGFVITSIYDRNSQYYSPKFSITYKGDFSKLSLIELFLVVSLTNGTYNVLKTSFKSDARNYPYNTLFSSLYRYSLSIPDTKNSYSNMVWNDIVVQHSSQIPAILIYFDSDGHIRGTSDITGYISVCKFLYSISEDSLISLNSAVSFGRNSGTDWLASNISQELDMYVLSLNAAKNNSVARSATVYVQIHNEEYEGSYKNLFNIEVIQEAKEGDSGNYPIYKFIMGEDNTEEIPITSNNEVTLYVDKTVNYISDSNEKFNNISYYTFTFIKEIFEDNVVKRDILNFNPNIKFLDNEGNQINWIRQAGYNEVNLGVYGISISIEPNNEYADSIFGGATGKVLIYDTEKLLLTVNIIKNENPLLPYYVFRKINTEDNWLLVHATQKSIELDTFSYDGGSKTIQYSIISTDELLYTLKLSCRLYTSSSEYRIEATVDLIDVPYIDSDLTLSDIGVLNEEKGRIQFNVNITVDSSFTKYYKKGTIFLEKEESERLITIDSIYINQYAASKSVYDVRDDENTIWDTYVEEENYLTCIDTGEGINVDPTSLLFKDGSANIYKTIESKDTRLFLGNYATLKERTNNIYRKGIDVFANLTVELGAPSNKIIDSVEELNENNYNSSNIRILKHNENYLLGVVFVYKTGLKSEVYFLDSKLNEGAYNLDKQFTTYGSNKYSNLFYIELTDSILEELNRAGIAAVIPVRAINISSKAIALGFAAKTFCINRKIGESLVYQYPYRVRLSLSIESGDFLQLTVYQSEVGTFDRSNILTLNSPEIDCTEDFTLSSINCYISKINDVSFNEFEKLIDLEIPNKYLFSKYDDENFVWYGYADDGDKRDLYSPSEKSLYGYMKIYIWNKDIIGAEGPNSKTSKKVYVFGNNIEEQNNSGFDYDKSWQVKCFLYRNYDYTQLLKLDNLNNAYYLGNIDYMLSSSTSYSIPVYTDPSLSEISRFVLASVDSDTARTGIGSDGLCYAPIWMRYKAIPHLVISTQDDILEKNNYGIVELYNKDTINRDNTDRIYSQWIKCGPIVSTSMPISRPLRFMAGDWFYGTYECLRTYPYSNSDPNSIVEVVKGKLVSKVNLVCRADVNKGVISSYLNPTNFNIFNPVYNQEDNFFTYQYISDNVSFDRNFVNTIQWSMNKVYGDETDAWCNIHDVNVLDLDGDKGELVSIERYNNTLLAFLESGISLILFNDNVQVATNVGTPIEILNSGVVEGKRYLHTEIGCLNRKSIVSTPRNLYFIDGLTKSLYAIGNDGIVDICQEKGMKSWALHNLNKYWWCYYDLYSLEVLITSRNNCLVYNDYLQLFSCFADYSNVNNVLHLNGRTYLFNPNLYMFYDSEVPDTIPNITPLRRSPSITPTEKWKGRNNTLWKKNSINKTTIFGENKFIELELIVNPEPTEDKTFDVLEYRADGFVKYDETNLFSSSTQYQPAASFETIEISNEYLSTGEISLYSSSTKNNYIPNSNLLKKFRIWRILIPRASKLLNDTSTQGMDKIRNPWCKIKLKSNMTGISKFIVHDFAVKYFK